MNFRLLALSVWLLSSSAVTADEPSTSTGRASAPPTAATSRADWSPNAASDDAESRTVERFLLVLERNPRQGTALDRVIEFHRDRGTLDEVARQQREKAEAIGDAQAAEGGRAWMVVGLIEDSRGETEAAVAAFERAEKLLPTNAMASFSLGQCLITLNQLPQAAEAFERAIQRKPAPVDLLDIFQSLGRVRQRLADGDQVVEVWARLEKLAPNDSRVPELIALTLLEDGHIEAALPRFESLAKAAKDPAKRSQFELEAIDIRLRLGQTEQALADSERMLAGLKPEHWLFRETRRRIEQAFVANGDEAGLIKHFETRLAKRPDDVDAVVRLSRALVGQSRSADARSRLEAALKQAPSSSVLRLELIGLLEQDQEFAEAVAQYELLDRIEPNHPDHIREWGFLILKSGERGGVSSPVTSESDDRRTNQGPDSTPLAKTVHARRAGAIWRKLVDAKPKDAVVAAQVAEWMRQADLFDDAAGLLRRAVELAPEALHHREALGEVLHSQQKRVEALAAWRSMAEGPRRSADNLGQLADVLGRKGFRDESLKTIDEACELDRRSLELRFQQADLRRMWKQFESAMSALAEAAALADTPETFDRVVQVEVTVLSESELLIGRIEELQAELARREGSGVRISVLPSDSKSNDDSRQAVHATQRPNGAAKQKSEHLTPALPALAAQWFRLSRYLETATRMREATAAANKAVELAPRVSLFLQAAARMLAADNQWQGAIDAYERLIASDRKFRVDSLRAIAELESKLGRRERALKAGRDLLVAAPGNADHAEFVADLCLRFNLQPEALKILRRSSRQNPADKRLALKLTEQLLASPVVQVSGGRQPPGSTDDLKSSQTDEVTADTPGGLRPPLASRISPIDEAREALWRVFERSSKLDDRLEVIRKLSELAVVPGEFDKLTQRLTRLRQEPKLSRDATLGLVQVHEQAGDTGQARRELERLLPQSPRDPDLLKRLIALCESSGDLEAAIAHQRRLLGVTRSREADEHLIALLRRAGGDAEADILATRWLESERDPAKVLREIDRLIGNAVPAKNQSVHQALKLTQAWLDRDPQNWEFLFRQASALHELNWSDEKSWAVLDELMALPISDDTMSVLAASRTPGTTHAERTTQRIQQIRSRTDIEKNAGMDYGSARIACLFARLVRKVEPTIPPAAGLDAKATALRTAWDEVYLHFLKGNGTDRLRVRLELLSLVPDDPGAQWLTLTALYGLRTESSFRPLAAWKEIDTNNSLDADALDRLIAAFRSLRTCDEAMEWDRTPIIEMLCRELIRAGRKDAVQELLAELERTSESPEAFGWLLQQAAINDDSEAALRILSKFTSLDFGRTKFNTTARGTTRRSDPANVAWWLSRCMIERRQSPVDQATLSPQTLRILDAAFEAFASANLSSSVSNPTVSTQTFAYSLSQNRNQPRYGLASTPYDLGLVWNAAEQFRAVKEDFPSAEAMSDLCAIHVLRQAWSQAQTPRARAELSAQVQSSFEKSEPDSRHRFLCSAAQASLQWWDHSQSNETARRIEEPLKTMRTLFDLPQTSPTLKLNIAVLHLNHEQPELALDLLDRITTTDGQQLKAIEQRAVQLAGKLRRTERVQLAAERLFGMRLEPQEELQLAATLSGLGLHEQAEAIRQRAPQRFGNDIGSLLALLEQRLKENKPNEASQVAEQILLRTHPAGLAASAGGATGAGTQTANHFLPAAQQARKKALETLASSGRLRPFIEQAEKQFDRSPQSLRLVVTLTELYSVWEQHDPVAVPEKRTALFDRLAKTDAIDPLFRLHIARALVAAGRARDAGPHYLFVLDKSPTVSASLVFEAQQLFEALGQVEELTRIVLKSRLAVSDEQRVDLFGRLVFKLEGPPIQARLIIELFEQAWRDAPGLRPLLIRRLLTVHDSVWHQEELWPLAKQCLFPEENSTAVTADQGIDIVELRHGTWLSALLLRVVELAAEHKKLDELARETDAAMKRHPQWRGGQLILGFVRLRQNNIEKARTLFAEFLKSGAPAWLVSCAVGAELARVPELVDIAIRFYEPVATFRSTPATPDAVRLILEHFRPHSRKPAFQELTATMLQRLLAISAETGHSDKTLVTLLADVSKTAKELDQPYLAARLAHVPATFWRQPGANNSDGGEWLKQVDERFAQACSAIKPEMLPSILRQVATESLPASQPRLDLLLQVTGESVAEMQLHSSVLASLKLASRDENLWAEVIAELDRLGEKFPDDVSIAIASAFAELHQPQPPIELPKVAALARRETQQAESVAAAVPKIGLWLIARECLAQPTHRELGERLAAVAIGSAKRQRDARFLWSIHREHGLLLLKAGSRDAAQAEWERLVTDVLRPRTADETVTMFFKGALIAGGEGWPTVRLQRARELARMTLEHSLTDLSLRTFREAVTQAPTEFHNVTFAETDRNFSARRLSFDPGHLMNAMFSDVVATWDELEPLWREKGVSSATLLDLLVEIVLPPQRPDEVFVFAQSLDRLENGVPVSLGQRLVSQALALKQVEQLKTRLTKREENVTQAPPALALRMLWLQLALATADDKLLAEQFTRLERHDWRRPTTQEAQLAAHIVLLLAQRAEQQERTAALFETLLQSLTQESSRHEHPIADLRRWLARYHLERERPDKARELIAAHLRHMDGVWSGVGAMDGQHLRRLELLALARNYAAAGLDRESLELLGHVADARWPDKYPDENPGPVLALLESNFASRPAAERYLLWRSWAFLDDGRTSLRLMTGAAENSKSEVRNPKSEIPNKSQISNFRFQISDLRSTAHLLVDAAQAANRLDELALFVDEQAKKRPSDRLHVLQTLIRLAQKQMPAAEQQARQQITLWESQSAKTGSVTRTRLWDDWLVAEVCRPHEDLREISRTLAKRAIAGARELNDRPLLDLAGERRE